MDCSLSATANFDGLEYIPSEEESINPHFPALPSIRMTVATIKPTASARSRR